MSSINSLSGRPQSASRADNLLALQRWSGNRWTHLISPILPHQSLPVEIVRRIIIFIPLVFATLVSYLGRICIPAAHPNLRRIDVAANPNREEQGPLLNQYRVVFQSPLIQEVEEAQIFLIGERHTSPGCKQLNGRFIMDQASEDVIFLTEGIESMQQVPLADRDFRLGEEGVSLPGQPVPWKSCEMYGWDIPQSSEFDREIDEYIAAKRKITNGKALKDLSPAQKRKYSKLMDAILERSSQRFPDRTRAMVETLRRIKDLIIQKQFRGKIFLIAGANHLRCVEPEDPRCSLEPLYAELQHHRAVVLVPKMLDR